MNKTEKNQEIKPVPTGDLQVRDKEGRFIKGVSGNPSGREVGSENFKTKWLKFIDKLAEQNGTTSEDVDEELLQIAFDQMKKADFRYWKDIQDRVYGPANEGKGTIIPIQINIDSDKEKYA